MKLKESLPGFNKGLKKIKVDFTEQLVKVLSKFEKKYLVLKKMRKIENTEAWNSFKKFRNSMEVADVRRHLLWWGKVRWEIFILEKGIPTKRVYLKEPLALYPFKEINGEVVYDILDLVKQYDKLRKKYSDKELIVDFNMFEYIEDWTLAEKYIFWF